MSSQAAPETAVTAPRRSVSRGLLKSASDLLGLSGSRRAPARKFGALSSLRGHSGAAFEGEAKIARDVPLCLCCASSQPAHLLVKGCHLFAFARSPEDDATPKYAIPLDGLAASVETAGAGTPARTVVVYKKLHGGAEYVVQFEEEDSVEPFIAAVGAAANLANLDRIKDKLGHERVPRTDSVLYADKVGQSFAKDQPEHDTTVEEAGHLAMTPGLAY